MNATAAALRIILRERYGEDIEVPDDLDGLDALLAMARHTTHRAWRDDPMPPGLVAGTGGDVLAQPACRLGRVRAPARIRHHLSGPPCGEPLGCRERAEARRRAASA